MMAEARLWLSGKEFVVVPLCFRAPSQEKYQREAMRYEAQRRSRPVAPGHVADLEHEASLETLALRQRLTEDS